MMTQRSQPAESRDIAGGRAEIRIVMPTSFEESLIERLVAANHRYAGGPVRVRELYGSLPRIATGTGRPGRSLPDVDPATFERHVALARAHGFEFTSLFNTSCTANREFDPDTRARFIDELHRARDLGCHAIVVASPYLIELAACHAPELRIHVSSVAFVKSTKEARHYIDRGAARLVLDPDTVRDFRFLRRLRRECPELELEVLCNHPCLLNCPYETYCYNSASHGSTCDDAAAYEAFSLLRCNLDKLRDPAEFVKGSWFRPQDLRLYREVGVTAIKIAGRGRSTDWLAKTAEAYLSQDYQGDMLDLVWDAQQAAVWRSAGRTDAPPKPVAAPASAFDGFLDHFARNTPDCGRGCGSCRHCDGFARRGLSIDPTRLDEMKGVLADAADRLLQRPVV